MHEAEAETLLARIRWPNTIHCPCCGDNSGYALNIRNIQRPRYKCRKCRRQFSVTKGTILEGVRAPLSCWVATVQWACNQDASIKRPCDLCSRVGVGTRAADNAITRLMYAQCREPLRGLILANNPRNAGITERLSRQLCLSGLNWQHVMTALMRTSPPNATVREPRPMPEEQKQPEPALR
jgi:hypothetical protein